MITLANTDVIKPFTIPQSDWTTINDRINYIMKLVHMGEDYVQYSEGPDGNSSNLSTNVSAQQLSCGFQIPNLLQMPGGVADKVMSLDISGEFNYETQIGINIFYKQGGVWQSTWIYPPHSTNLVRACRQFPANVIAPMSELTGAISEYAKNAISGFQAVNTQLSNNSNTVTSGVQTAVQSAVNNLNSGTQSVSSQANALMRSLQEFMSYNNTFFQYFSTNSFLVPLLNCPMLEPAAVTNFNEALGAVLGAWSAIATDLASVVSTCTDLNSIDLPFIESLQIESAISLWKSIESETNTFGDFFYSLTQNDT